MPTLRRRARRGPPRAPCHLARSLQHSGGLGGVSKIPVRDTGNRIVTVEECALLRDARCLSGGPAANQRALLMPAGARGVALDALGRLAASFWSPSTRTFALRHAAADLASRSRPPVRRWEVQRCCFWLPSEAVVLALKVLLAVGVASQSSRALRYSPSPCKARSGACGDAAIAGIGCGVC